MKTELFATEIAHIMSPEFALLHKHRTPDVNAPLRCFAGHKFHFTGIGGVGMSGLAKLLIRNHATVSGSDLHASSVTDSLAAGGASITIGHSETCIPAGTEAVVISAAIKEENPELMHARSNGIRVLKYAQMLGLLMDCYTGIAVCGTHGKSTTTGWIAWLLMKAGLDPSFVVGAEIPQCGTSSGPGSGRHFVAEACEFDRSFLNLHPHIGVILNIESDHLDYYRDEAEIVEAFGQFVRGVKPDGIIIANGEDANVAKATACLPAGVRLITFGMGEGCDFHAANIEVVDGLHHFDVYHGEECLGRTRISLAGRHNVCNALAVVATCTSAGASPAWILNNLDTFTGMDRRCMFKAKISGITVLDDYAHHPTEIRASLQGIRQRYKPERIFCVFQPHQYSRTRFLLDDFAKSFTLADVTVVPEIYFVRDSEQNRQLVNSKLLVEKVRNNGCEAVFADSFVAICQYLKENVSSGDLVVTMGAGDIWKVADEYIRWLGRDS
ncbi:MAG TPA: UDP-N-acetylmuramate--L-alanine ligase [Sedimentisphaerales bacterium]|nr:UDP-N-acetylmuramate--L-alanine ligase [Sedimentisphaerales bacterium]